MFRKIKNSRSLLVDGCRVIATLVCTNYSCKKLQVIWFIILVVIFFIVHGKTLRTCLTHKLGWHFWMTCTKYLINSIKYFFFWNMAEYKNSWKQYRTDCKWSNLISTRKTRKHWNDLLPGSHFSFYHCLNFEKKNPYLKQTTL